MDLGFRSGLEGVRGSFFALLQYMFFLAVFEDFIYSFLHANKSLFSKA